MSDSKEFWDDKTGELGEWAEREHKDKLLRRFISESYGIEGIFIDPEDIDNADVAATQHFLALETITVEDMQELALSMGAECKLRERKGMNVQVGGYTPVRGGPGMQTRLNYVLDSESSPYLVHRQYEKLHPFMDGNGRTGRLLWLWQTMKLNGGVIPAIGFLHTWYYESLKAGR